MRDRVQRCGDKGRRVSRPALLLMLMAFVAYTYTIPRGPLANADTRVALTRAIVDDHTLRIDRYAAGLADRSAYRGHFYTDKPPGTSLLAVPVYAVLRRALAPSFFSPGLFFVVRYLLTAAVVSLPAAAFVALLWRFLLPLVGRRGAALLAVAYGFGTMAWALSALLFSHALAAMSLFGAFILLYPASAGRGRVVPWRWAAAGALCGFAVCLEYPAGLVGLLLALFAAHTAGKAGRRGALAPLAAFVVAAATGAAPVALYDWAVYGNPLSQGYAHLHGATQFIAGMSHGVEGVGLPSAAALWGITFSPYRGLFVLSPFLLLALPGLRAMWRRRQRPAALLCAAAGAVMLLFNSSYYFWDGGVSLGPRHFSPALPFLTFPVAFALRRSPWHRLAPWLIGLSVGIVAVCCVTVLIFLPGVPDPIVMLAMAHLLHGPAPNNWGMLLGLRGELSLAPLVAVEAALGVALWRALRLPRRTPMLGAGAHVPAHAA
jgi:hypothetical protein